MNTDEHCWKRSASRVAWRNYELVAGGWLAVAAVIATLGSCGLISVPECSLAVPLPSSFPRWACVLPGRVCLVGRVGCGGYTNATYVRSCRRWYFPENSVKLRLLTYSRSDRLPGMLGETLQLIALGE